MAQGLEVLELPLAGLVALAVGFVEHLHRADLTAVVDVGGHGKSALKIFGNHCRSAVTLLPSLD